MRPPPLYRDGVYGMEQTAINTDLQALVPQVARENNLGDAIDLFKVDNGFYPQQLSDLWERPANAKNWGPEAYLKEYPPTDPWGNEYMYERGSGSTRHSAASSGAKASGKKRPQISSFALTSCHIATASTASGRRSGSPRWGRERCGGTSVHKRSIWR